MVLLPAPNSFAVFAGTIDLTLFAQSLKIMAAIPRRMAALVVLMPVLFATSIPGASAQSRLSNDQIVRNFDIIALRNEYSRVANPRIAKWVRPLRVYIQEDVVLEQIARKDLLEHMARLRRLTRLKIGYVSRRSRANFIIIFTRLDDFARQIRRNMKPYNRRLARRLGRAACIGLYSRVKETNEIRKAVVIIPVDFAYERGIFFHCVVEETTQVLGLPNDSGKIDISIFNDYTRRDDLSWHDKLLLRILYHPRMKVGLPRARALGVARSILPELRQRAGR